MLPIFRRPQTLSQVLFRVAVIILLTCGVAGIGAAAGAWIGNVVDRRTSVESRALVSYLTDATTIIAGLFATAWSAYHVLTSTPIRPIYVLLTIIFLSVTCSALEPVRQLIHKMFPSPQKPRS